MIFRKMIALASSALALAMTAPAGPAQADSTTPFHVKNQNYTGRTLAETKGSMIWHNRSVTLDPVLVRAVDHGAEVLYAGYNASCSRVDGEIRQIDGDQNGAWHEVAPIGLSYDQVGGIRYVKISITTEAGTVHHNFWRPGFSTCG
ncbi:hypothetical protein [Nonomuraea soli]|uniref:Discoidin domain-containing protein n=1 Tax=Nonomuraea soli TaxID=1032476 RepID=A0A7W0HWE3_9ACTN|nr:hypothetical protein [Nonomuraea soli]MBA2898012.1 hypothetical protein [Nonomuraea soli]